MSVGGDALGERLAALGRSLGEREAAHREALAAARAQAERLRGEVVAALERFHAAAEAAGAPHLRVEVSPLRSDDKHLRAVEFELRRGRHTAIVTVKSRGDLTLVGPFRQGKPEGPCRSFPFAAPNASERASEGAPPDAAGGAELREALTDFLAVFLEEAATP